MEGKALNFINKFFINTNRPAKINPYLEKEILSTKELQEYFKGKMVNYIEDDEFVHFCNPELSPVYIRKSNLKSYKNK